jgi:hypothetical protein
MARAEPRLIALGYGKFASADRIYALVPLEGDERGDGRRTLVYVDGLADPIVASRSERAIVEDLAAGPQAPRRRDPPGQAPLFSD